MVIPHIMFWGPTKFSTVAKPSYIPPAIHNGSNFSPSSQTVPSGYGAVAHCGFDLHVPQRPTMLSIFSCACWPFVYLVWRNVCSSSLPTFNWVVCLSVVEMQEFFLFSGYYIHIRYTVCKYMTDLFLIRILTTPNKTQYAYIKIIL